MTHSNEYLIPVRQFGRHEVRISALGFGGHHLGDAPDECTAISLVRQAVDGGVTFFDSIKVGADFRYLQNLRVPSDQHRSGELYFTSDRTRGPDGGGLGLASYLIGDVSSFQRYVSNSLDAGERQNRQFFYAQDTWKISPKLTLNYGLRWEIYYPQTVTGARKGGWINIDTGEVMIAG